MKRLSDEELDNMIIKAHQFSGYDSIHTVALSNLVLIELELRILDSVKLTK